MKHALSAVVVALTMAGAVAAQNPPGDTTRPPMPGPMMGQRMPMMQGQMPRQTPEQLRMQIEERWSRMVQTELELTDPQMERLRTAERANQDRHRDLGRREEDLHRSVKNQLQPGVAANNDSLTRSLDALAAIRVQHAQSDQQLLRDIAFLTPVQRARYFVMAQRFRDRIQALRQGGPPAGMAPGVRPNVQPRQPMRRPGIQEFDER